VCEKLYKTSLRCCEKGGFPLVLAATQLAAGSVAATADFLRRDGQPVGLIWVDAHGDMNTPATQRSGNVHGMPLASLLGPEPSELSRIGGFSRRC
jgi:arginase